MFLSFQFARMFIRMPQSKDLKWGSLIKSPIPGSWAMLIIIVTVVTAFQPLTDKLWRRSTVEVELE